jgi:hypothetical protein
VRDIPSLRAAIQKGRFRTWKGHRLATDSLTKRNIN